MTISPEARKDKREGQRLTLSSFSYELEKFCNVSTLKYRTAQCQLFHLQIYKEQNVDSHKVPEIKNSNQTCTSDLDLSEEDEVKPLENVLSQLESVLLANELGSELFGGEKGDVKVRMEGEEVEGEGEKRSSVSDG